MKNAFMSSHHTEDLQKLSFHLLCVEWQLLLNASFNSAWSPSIQREIWHRAPMAAQQIKISKGQWLLVTWGPELEPPPPAMMLSWCHGKAHGRRLTFRSKAREEPSAGRYLSGLTASKHFNSPYSTSTLFFFHLLHSELCPTTNKAR